MQNSAPTHRASSQSTADALMERAHALMEVRRLADAVQLLHQALAVEPDHYEALCLLGECLWRQSRTDEALAALERAVAKQPEEEMAFSLMAWVLVQKYLGTWRSRGRWRRRALETAQTALKLEPEHPRALAAMTGVMLNLYSARKALPYIERHLSVDPDQHYAYGNMAAAKYSLRQWDEAESFARRAIEINPQAVKAMTTLGAVLIAKRRYRAAIKVLNQALAIDADNPVAKSNLAFAADRLIKDVNPADLPDGTKKSARQTKIEGAIAVAVVAFLFLAAIPVRLLTPGSTYEQAVGACLVVGAVPLLVCYTIWRRREFKRLPKGTQMLLQKVTKRKRPWLP